ncbi:MAG: hypothetical protein ACYC09_04160 [Bacteroidota bacterium]
MEYTMRQRAKNIVIYILCSLMFVIAGTSLIREKSFHNEYRYLTIGGDAASYIAMAEGTGEEIPAPFRYRLFFPALASLFDLPAITVFRWITIGSLFLFYLTGFLLCELRRYPLTVTIMSMMFVFLSPWHLYIYQNPFITDGLVQLTIMVLLFSVMQKNIWLFVVIALAGIFLHERIIFFLPLWWAVHDGRRGTIIAATIGLVYVGLRLAVGSTGGSSLEYPAGNFSIFINPLETMKDAIVGSLPLYLIAVTGYLFQNTEEKQRTRPILFLFLTASAIPAVVATDTGRMLLGLAPLAVVLNGSFFTVTRFSVWGIAIIACSVLIGMAYLPVTFIPIPDWLIYRKAVIAASMTLLLICYGIFMLRSGRTAIAR